MAGVIYMVATPIGNLGDITGRALEILEAVSFIACEDTRVTKKLTSHFGISKELVSIHHHTPEEVLLKLVERIKKGENVAYVSDAGTPGLADPGGKLVKLANDKGITIIPIPGPSAVTAALSVAGLPANAYLFLGYPPHKKGRQSFWRQVSESVQAVVFFESTHRILKALRELGSVIDDREIVVGRELTKIHETIYRGSCSEVLQQIINSSIKGEFVVVVSPK